MTSSLAARQPPGFLERLHGFLAGYIAKLPHALSSIYVYVRENGCTVAGANLSPNVENGHLYQ
jgi:hypothetical protein